MVEYTTSVLPSEYIPGKQLKKIQETGQDLGPRHLPETDSKTSTFYDLIPSEITLSE